MLDQPALQSFTGTKVSGREETALADAVSSEKLLLQLFQMLEQWLLVTVKVTEEGLKI